MAWLNIYMQMAYLKEDAEVLIAQYPQATFIQIAEVGLFKLSASGGLRALHCPSELRFLSAFWGKMKLEIVMRP